MLQSKLVLFLENQQSPIDLGLNHKDRGFNLPKHGLKAKDLSIQDIDQGIYLLEDCHEDVAIFSLSKTMGRVSATVVRTILTKVKTIPTMVKTIPQIGKIACRRIFLLFNKLISVSDHGRKGCANWFCLSANGGASLTIGFVSPPTGIVSPTIVLVSPLTVSGC